MLVLFGSLAQDAHKALGDVKQSKDFERQKATVDFLEVCIIQLLNVGGLQGVGGGGHGVGSVRWCPLWNVNTASPRSMAISSDNCRVMQQYA